MYKIYEIKTFNSRYQQRRQQKGATKITVIFADSQSDCSKNIPPSNMRYIAASLTNQIVDILCVDDKLHLMVNDVNSKSLK